MTGGIDLHRPVPAVGNENAVDQRQSLDAMVSAVADGPGRCRLIGSASTIRPSVGVDAPVPPAGEAVAAGHHVDQVQCLDRSFGNLADEVGRFGGRTEHDHAIAAALIAALLHAGRFVLVQDSGNGFRLSVSGGHLQPDRAAEDVRRGVPLLAHLDAKLRAQVGDDGGGSLDSE